MSYLVFARKYRPRTFDEVVGQESAATTLRNAITSGRVAHAYLFTGPRGVGKTSMARILAKALNCERGPTPEPCNQCAVCKSIDTGEDVDVVEIDGASNRGIEDIRTLRENVRYAPARARFKIYIIDEVHMLSKDAFNALLKTLEEPPPHVKFIFATTEAHKLMDTIKSRCQRFDFRRIAASAIARHLAAICKKEKIKAEDGVLDAIARSVHGGMRDAESLLDQLAALAPEKIAMADLELLVGAVSPQTVLDLLGAVAAHDARRAVEIVDHALAKGAADDELIEQLIDGFRELLLARVAGADSPLIDRGDAERKALAELAARFSVDALMFLVQMFAETKHRARESSQSRVVLELALIKAAEVHQLRPLDEILAQLDDAGSGGHAARPRAAAPVSKPSEAATAPAAPAAPLRTGDLWSDMLSLVQQQKAGLAALMAGASFRSVEGPVAAGQAAYVIELGPVAVEQAKANKGLIEKALAEASGKPCAVELRPAAPKPGAAPRRTDSAEPQSQHVKKALDMFHARVVTTNNTRKERTADGQGV